MKRLASKVRHTKLSNPGELDGRYLGLDFILFLVLGLGIELTGPVTFV